MRSSLSVTLICKDEEQNIVDCLGSVSWADEIIVVDSGSTDKTVELAKQFTPKVIYRPWEGFAAQKQFALEQATCDYILSIDADERVTPGLKDEILTLLEQPQLAAGWYVPRRTEFFGKWITSCGWYPGYQLRLFKRGRVTVTQRKVHEGFVVEGNTVKLKHDLLHYTHESFEKTIAKINHYSSLTAEEKSSRKKITALNLFLNPVAAFFTHYFIKRGFTDGVQGFMVSVMHSMTNMMTYLKIYEIQKREVREQLHKKGMEDRS